MRHKESAIMTQHVLQERAETYPLTCWLRALLPTVHSAAPIRRSAVLVQERGCTFGIWILLLDADITLMLLRESEPTQPPKSMSLAKKPAATTANKTTKFVFHVCGEQKGTSTTPAQENACTSSPSAVNMEVTSPLGLSRHARSSVALIAEEMS